MKPKNPHIHLGRCATAGAAALALGILSAPTASAEVIAGWDTFSGAGAVDPVDAPVVATGITASFVTTTEGLDWHTTDERGASNDGTWGTSVGPPSADTSVADTNDQNLELPNGTTGGTITITITNNSGADIELDSFHFDSYAFRPNAARAYELSVLAGGAITEGVIYISADDEIPHVAGAWANDAHDDIDHDLTGLADSTLEDGGTVEFLLAFSSGTGSGGGHDLWVDNLAVTSSVADADRLAVTIVPASATAGTDFSVTVEAQDGSGNPLSGVTQDTEILLTASGSGILSGKTATIPMGSNSVTLPAVQYTVAEDITLVASQVSGDLLAPSAESSTITINAGPPTVLTVESAADGSGTPVGNTSFRINDPFDILEVFAISRDSVGNFIGYETGAVFTLENITGEVLPADLVDNMDGSATFTAAVLGTATIRAAVTGFPDADSGLITVEEPQFRWTATANGAWGQAANWLDGILPPFDNTTDIFLRDEYAVSRQTYISSNRTVRSLNFTRFADGSHLIRFTQNGIDGARNLTFDTDSLVDPAEINVDAGADGNLNLGNVNVALNPDDYGDIILADPLRITHLGTGVLIFDRPITETGGSMGVTLDASSTGTVVYRGANAYTGPTTVNGGILRINGDSIPAALVIDGGIVEVTGTEYVSSLQLGGGPVQTSGTFDATSDPEHISGTGSIVVGAAPIEGIVITDIAFTGEEEITITFTSPTNVDVYASLEPDSFDWFPIAEDQASGTYVDEFASEPRIYYLLVPAGDPAP